MIIRQATKDDVKKLPALNDAAFAHNPGYDPDAIPKWAHTDQGKNYFANLLNDQNTVCFVAEDKEKLVGYIAAAPKSFDDRVSKYIEIQNLGVTTEYRKQGIGQQLMEKCIAWAKTKGYQKAYLKCYFKNADALSFYKKNGFTEISVCLEKEI